MATHDLLPWYDADLPTRLALGMRYCERILFPEYGNRPHFGYNRDAETGEGFAYGCPWRLMAHAVGRGMDLMLNYEKYTGTPASPAVESAYTRHFYAALDEDFGMCLEYTAEGQPWKIELHNVRETIEALTLLAELRNDPRALEEMEKIYRGFDAILEPRIGHFSEQKAIENGVRSKFNRSIEAMQPRTAGRLTGPLMEYHRLTGDNRALHYAALFAEGTLRCFEDSGAIKDTAGPHVHSITSSLSGAADYAVFTDNEEMLAKIKRICTHPLGVPQMMTDFGWAKEFLSGALGRGETNQIADMAMLYMLLGRHNKDTRWYAKAETCMRSGVLPAQVLRNDFLTPAPETEDDHKKDIPARILGGYGFPSPAAHLGRPDATINTLDITQGANQAICRTMDHIVTAGQDDVYVNMLFTGDAPAARVRSALPKAGRVDILPKRACRLHIRVPEAVEADSVSLLLDGEPALCTAENGYLVLPVRPYDMVTLRFTPTRRTYSARCNEREYTITQFGEQVVDITPMDGIYPLYGSFFE